MIDISPNNQNQQTIKKSINVSGIGLHSGNVILIVLLGLILGGLGASLSVRRQIAVIEPE